MWAYGLEENLGHLPWLEWGMWDTWEAAEHGVFYRDSSETVKTELGSSWEQLRQGEELSQLFLPECFSLQGLCKI